MVSGKNTAGAGGGDPARNGGSAVLKADLAMADGKEDEMDEDNELEVEDDEDDEDEDDDGLVSGPVSDLPSELGTPMVENDGCEESSGELEEGKKDNKKRKLDNEFKSGDVDVKQESFKNEIVDNSAKKVPKHLLEKRRLGRIKAAEAFAKKLKTIGIEKVENKNTQPFGLFQPVVVLSQKNCSSDYLRSSDQVFVLRERKHLRSALTTSFSNNTTTNSPDAAEAKSISNAANADEEAKNEEDIDFRDSNSTIVIHPGSSTIKIGFAKDEAPLMIPNCVAIPRSSVNTKKEKKVPQHSTEYELLKDQIEANFKERMRFYKRKIQPNAHERVRTFNKTVKPELVEDKNDHGRVSWISTPDRIYYGEEAERCSKDHFIVRRPFSGGGALNLDSPHYKSLPVLLTDIASLIAYALKKLNPEIKESQFSQYKVVLVVPDLFGKSHVETMIRFLLKELQFQAVAIMQESLAACYGAGTSTSTCIVNIGATQTKIACIDEGAVLDSSLITLDYGGDDITKLFCDLILENDFPYQDLDLSTSHGWMFADQLKKDFVTFEDANVTVQLYNFMKRIPGKKTEKLEFKVFDEVMLSPMALFYPDIFKQPRQDQRKPTTNKILRSQLPVSRDLYTEMLNDCKSISQLQCLDNKLYCGDHNDLEILKTTLKVSLNPDDIDASTPAELEDNRKNYVPLEKAIIQSITNASASVDISKMSQFYSNILLMGGSSNIPSLDFILADRVNIWKPKFLTNSAFPNFYKNLSKKVKDILSTNKATTTPEEEEKIKQSVKILIERELSRYMETTKAQTGNDYSSSIAVLPPPSNLDPAALNWKGASVLAQIKLVEELYITNSEWDVLGSRTLQHKCLFPY